jgi:DNA adenine methylase
MVKETNLPHSGYNEKVEPFLRWAGGKRFLVNRFMKFIPPDFHQRVYREPFLGSGSLFFALRPKGKAILSDANEHLINCYEYIKKCPDLIAYYLQEHKRKDSKRYYYEVRNNYNRLSFSAAQAARFIYLNRTCFNGIFRVNLKGQFNVPYGWKENPIIPDKVWLRKASLALKNTILKSQPFDKALNRVDADEFIYLDPPYPPLNTTSNFTRYTKDKFSMEEHKLLAEKIYELDSKGCLIMISNADIPGIHKLFKRFHVTSLPVTRYITCKAIKHKVRELVITNYKI